MNSGVSRAIHEQKRYINTIGQVLGIIEVHEKKNTIEENKNSQKKNEQRQGQMVKKLMMNIYDY